MTKHELPALASRQRTMRGFNDLRSIDLDGLGVEHSPISLLDDFRAVGLPFPPHPHAGFAAVTYIFEDSATELRSRSSVGDDVVVGPGGIVWSEAGRGMLHEESASDARRELHGAQIFVNISRTNELTPPRVLALQAGGVPEWRNATGDRVRVVAGTHEQLTSPLEPIEPFTLLDAEIHQSIAFDAPHGHHLVVYARDGVLEVGVGEITVVLRPGEASVVHGQATTFTVSAQEPGHALVLGGAAIDERPVVDGPFIMSDQHQIADAARRYQSGAMGRLDRSFV